MKHRHQGPKVQYTTKKGNVKYRKRPIHNITRKKIIRKHSFFPREEDTIEKTFTKEGRYIFPRDREEDEEGRRGSRKFIRLAKPGFEGKTEDTLAFFDTREPEDIFIHELHSEDPEEVAETIAHEELHKTLFDEQGFQATSGLDNIRVPQFVDDEGNLSNPKTAGILAGSIDAVADLVRDEADEAGMEFDIDTFKIDMHKRAEKDMKEARAFDEGYLDEEQ